MDTTGTIDEFGKQRRYLDGTPVPNFRSFNLKETQVAVDKFNAAKPKNNGKSSGMEKASASNSKTPKANPLPAPKVGRVKDPYR